MNPLVASVLGVLYALSEIALGVRRRAAARDTQLADRGSLILLWVVIVVSMNFAYSLAYSLPTASLGAAAIPVGVMGVGVFAGGILLRWYSIYYLGRFFTVNVAIAADHRLIDGGPYRHIRHPSYTGALLAFLGLGLCLGNWASIAVAVVPTFLVFLHRMRVEEAALLQGLGAPYRDYMTRTKRLIPALY